MEDIQLNFEEDSIISLKCTLPDKSIQELHNNTISLIHLQCTAPDVDNSTNDIQLQCTVPNESTLSFSNTESEVQLQCTVPNESLTNIELKCTVPNDSTEFPQNLAIPIDKALSDIQLQCTVPNESLMSFNKSAIDIRLPSTNIVDPSSTEISNLTPKEPEVQSSFHNSLEMLEIENAISNNILLTGELANPDKLFNRVQVITHYTNSIESIYENKQKSPLIENVSPLAPDPTFDILKISTIQPKVNACDPFSCLTPPSQPVGSPRFINTFDLISTPSLTEMTSKIMIPNQISQAAAASTDSVVPESISFPNESMMPMQINQQEEDTEMPDTNKSDDMSDGDSMVAASIIEDYQFPLIAPPLAINYDEFDSNLNSILFMNYQFVLTDNQYRDAIEHRGGRCASIYELQDEFIPIFLTDVPTDKMPYLLALAMDIPRIASIWIDDCIEQNELLSFHGYHLANGYLNKSPIFANYKPNLFKNESFVIQSNEDRKWAHLIEQCGADIALNGRPINAQILILSLVQQINLFQ